jgi:hypothetical protein
MSKVKIQGNASGTGVVTLTAPNTNTDRTITLPDGTGDIGIVTKSATAPSSPAQGDMWFDTTAGTDVMKVWNGTVWHQMSNIHFSATGGTETTYTSGGVNYKVHTFTSSGTFTAESSGTVDVLVVAGGGGGGSWVGGGGGAGGMLASILSVSAQSFTVTVGSGGVGSYNPGGYAGMPNGANGGNSSFSSLTAIGGGQGQEWSKRDAANGGSGGGSADGSPVGVGTSGQGNNGGTGHGVPPYECGGGGGAGGVGVNWATNKGGNGGIGKVNNYRTGANIYYAGGGGGGAHDAGSTPGTGGTGGGGNGLAASTAKAGSGSVNLGGGGGGTGNTGDSVSNAGNGGSGVVIIRYAV